jgi:transposase-like protein
MGDSRTTPPADEARRKSRRPVDDETRGRIAAAIRGGASSRNAIAREFGCSPSTVTAIAREQGIEDAFDRTASAAATEAVEIDNRSRRVALAKGMLDDVDKLRAMLFEPVDRVHYSVTNGEVHYETAPSPDELRNLFTSIGIAIDKHLVLDRADSDDRDLPAVEIFLRGMGVGVAS